MTQIRPSVFIGSSGEGLAVAQAIQVNLDHACEVVLWSQGVFGLSDGALESLVGRLETFDFAILVVSPDDMVTSRETTQNAPRDNVLLELGMFIGAIGRKRTFFVYDRTADIKIPSDLAGVTAATYQPHSDNNLQAALGAATTQIQNAINSQGPRERNDDSFAVQQDTTFQIIHDLLDDAAEQYIILMYESNIKIQRRRSVFDPRSRHEFWKRDGSGGMGGFSADDLCKKLPDAGLLTIDLRDQISITERGREFARWLVERGHKAAYFSCEFGSWGERPEEIANAFAQHVMQAPHHGSQMPIEGGDKQDAQ